MMRNISLWLANVDVKPIVLQYRKNGQTRVEPPVMIWATASIYSANHI